MHSFFVQPNPDQPQAARAQRLAQADEATRIGISDAIAGVEAAAEEQRSALAAERATVDESAAAVAACVEEQKALQASLVEATLAAVGRALEEQSALVVQRLEDAAAAILDKHRRAVAANEALGAAVTERAQGLVVSYFGSCLLVSVDLLTKRNDSCSLIASSSQLLVDQLTYDLLSIILDVGHCCFLLALLSWRVIMDHGN